MSSQLNFLDAFGFVPNPNLYGMYRGLNGAEGTFRTEKCALVYFPIIAQMIGVMRIVGAINSNVNTFSNSFRAGTIIRGIAEITYVLTPLLILIDIIVTLVRVYKLQQAVRNSRVID